MSAEMKVISPFDLPGTASTPYAERQTTERLQRELKEVDARIDTWMKICQREKIDISREEEALRQLKGLEDHRIALMDLVAREEEICHILVQKVRQNLKRVPPQETLDTLRNRLEELTMQTAVPWIRTARREGVDIAEECEVMKAANESSLETLREMTQNATNVKEVVQRRLYTIRLQCSIRIINKVYTQRIERLAEKEMSLDWFDDKRVEMIQGIKTDALRQLPREGALAQVKGQSAKVLRCFQKSIDLLNQKPGQYEEQADREWLKREVQERGRNLAGFAFKRGNEALAHEIFAARQIALGLFETDKSTEEIRKLVNETFEIYAERAACRSIPLACGFSEAGKGAGGQDDDSFF